MSAADALPEHVRNPAVRPTLRDRDPATPCMALRDIASLVMAHLGRTGGDDSRGIRGMFVAANRAHLTGQAGPATQGYVPLDVLYVVLNGLEKAGIVSGREERDDGLPRTVWTVVARA